MTLPWNRGDGDGAADSLVGLVPLLRTDAADDGGAGADQETERRDPILVAPHRDPGERPVNNRLPPGFERGRRVGPRGSSTDDARRPADGRHDDPAPPGPAEGVPSPSDRTPTGPSPAGAAESPPADPASVDTSAAATEPAAADSVAVGAATAADESGETVGDADEAGDLDDGADGTGDEVEDSTATLAVNDG